MRYLRVFTVAVLMLFPTAIPASAAEGLTTKPSANSVDATLDRLEAALKERGFIIFTRLDHAAAAQSVGLKMPRSTVLVFGNPRPRHTEFHPTPYLRHRPAAQSSGLGGCERQGLGELQQFGMVEGDQRPPRGHDELREAGAGRRCVGLCHRRRDEMRALRRIEAGRTGNVAAPTSLSDQFEQL